ncbi:hypothetical protein BC941DRAFT_450973 [Chlamydoabsidia padenii]|nr:hypothetical protein BC941DRAFT_450973 [Chlamydoabsidia padenii]
MAESIDPKSLRVVDLKEELGKRNLSKVGKKDELVARLTEALAEEASTTETVDIPLENNNDSNSNTAEMTTTLENSNDLNANTAETTTTLENSNDLNSNTTETTTTTLDNNKEPTQDDTPVKSDSTTSLEEPSDNVKSTANTPLEPLTTSKDTSVDASEDLTAEPPKEEVNKETDNSIGDLKRKHEDDSDIQQEKRSKPDETGVTNTKDKEPVIADQLAICIKGFVRPLITRNLREFVSQHGSIKRFWIDPIKTHCYVIYETLDQATDAFEKIDGTTYPPSTGKTVSVIRLTTNQASQLMDREQEVAEKHGRVNWEKLLERVLNNEIIDEPLSSETGASPSTSAKRRLGGLEQITRQLQQSGPASVIMDQEQQPSVSILDRLSSSSSPNQQFTPTTTVLPTRGKSLDELFKKTSAFPSLYYLPVDNDTAAKRLEAMKSR